MVEESVGDGSGRLSFLAKKYCKIAVLIPTYKLVPAVSFHCFSVFFAKLFGMGFTPSLFMLDQTNVAKARNELTRHFLKNHDGEFGPYDLVLWLDSDQTFTTGDFLKLLHSYDQHEMVRVLSARYVTRDNHEPRVCGFNLVSPDGSKWRAIDPEQPGIVELDGFGFGFNIMSPSVLQEMWAAYKGHAFEFASVGLPEDCGMIGEDLSWCMKAKKLGIHLFMHNGVDIGHYGAIMTPEVMNGIRVARGENVPKSRGAYV